MKKCLMVIIALLYSFLSVNLLFAATFSQADLTGTWAYHILETGSTSKWTHAIISFDASGNLTCSSGLDSTGSTTCPSAGTVIFTVGSNGVITASGVSAPPNLNMTMTSNKNFIAGTSDNGGSPPTRADLRIMQKVVPGTTYSNADLQNKLFVVHQLMTSTTGGQGWVYGAGTTDASGNVTLTSEADSHGGVNNGTGTQGTLSVDSNGVVTLTGSGNGNNATFNGFLSADKKTIVGTETELNGVTFDLIITLITGQTYTAGPLPSGTSIQHFIAEVDFTNSPNFMNNPYAFWVDQTQTVTSGGAYTLSNATSSLSGYTPSSGGTASITSSGTVTTTENSTYNGQMSYDGTFSVGTATAVDTYSDNWYMLIVHTMSSVNTNLYGSFAGSGIWKWNGTTWTQVTPNTAQLMVPSGATLYGSFTGGGIWKWNGTTWSQVTPNTPTIMAVSGSTLYGAFAGSGIWQWNGTTWTQVTPNNPQSMVTLGSTLYGSFTGAGIWQWNGATWTQVTPNSPTLMVATSTILYGSFTGGGIWQWDGNSWTQATPNNPQLLVTSGGNLYGSFAGGGIWQYNGTTWTQTTPNNPIQMVASNSNLYGSFTGGGIWQWNGTTWTQLTPNNPASMVIGY